MANDTDTMTDLAALLARVEGASGPDREIDAEVCATFRYMPGVELPSLAEGWEWLWESGWTFGDGPSVKVIPVRAGKREISGSTRKPQPVTASIDAAVALAEQMLPGCHWGVEGIGAPHSRYEARVITEWSEDGEVELQFEADLSTPALALVAAIIRAMQSR